MFETASEQACQDHLQLALETNHERTLYVQYVFRNSLIYGERGKNRIVRDGRSDHTDIRQCGRAAVSAFAARVQEMPVPQRD